jgi:hypothetical protein
MALKSVYNFVSYRERWPFALFDGAITEMKPVSIGSGFRVLHVVERVAPSIQTGLTGRRDLIPDLSGSSGTTTSKVLAGHNAGPLQLRKGAVEKVAIGDGWPFLLCSKMGFDRFMREPLSDRSQRISILIVRKDFNCRVLYLFR